MGGKQWAGVEVGDAFCAEDKHTFRGVALFDFVEASDGIGVAGIAADSPDGVGGVEDSATCTKDTDCGGDSVLHTGAKIQKKSVMSL